MNTWKYFFILAGMLMLCLNSCDKQDADTQEGPSAEELQVVPVEVITLEPTSFTESGVFYGTVQGLSEATLISHGGGQVTGLKVSAGQNIQKGQQLCSVDGAKFSAASESAQLQRKIAEGE